MLSYEDVGAAAAWIADAFGFRETGRWTEPDGWVTHANMELGGGVCMLGWPSPDYQSPKHHAEVCEQARTWSQTPDVVDGVLVYVDDVESHYERARAAGATILSEPEESLAIGQRQYRAADLEGHRWMFAEPTGAAASRPEPPRSRSRAERACDGSRRLPGPAAARDESKEAEPTQRALTTRADATFDWISGTSTAPRTRSRRATSADWSLPSR
jgi:PhnB protein